MSGKIHFWTIIALGVLGLGLGAGTISSNEDSVCQISGNVTLDGKPLAGATLDCWMGIAKEQSTVTDSSGNYMFQVKEIPDLLSYFIRCQAEKKGYVEPLGKHVYELPAQMVNFEFTSATVTGKVRNGKTGAPLAEANVKWYSLDWGQGLTATNANGDYQITLIYGQTVRLKVTASKSGFYPSPAWVDVPPGKNGVDLDLFSSWSTMTFGWNRVCQLGVGEYDSDNELSTFPVPVLGLRTGVKDVGAQAATVNGNQWFAEVSIPAPAELELRVTDGQGVSVSKGLRIGK